MSRVFESTGSGGLIEATEALFADETFDMAVVRCAIDPKSELLLNLDDGSRTNDYANTAALASELPQLLEVEGIVRRNWGLKGYTGMEIGAGFLLDQWRKPGIAPHVDELVYGDRKIEAGVQLSLCVKGLRKFYAERLDYNFRNDDGTFDSCAYEELFKTESVLQKDIRNGRKPRSQATLAPGDIALFPHHPVVALHSVVNVEPSIARLISYHAIKTA